MILIGKRARYEETTLYKLVVGQAVGWLVECAVCEVLMAEKEHDAMATML